MLTSHARKRTNTVGTMGLRSHLNNMQNEGTRSPGQGHLRKLPGGIECILHPKPVKERAS